MIRDLPETERPKEKLMANGAEALSTSELIALIIRTGTRERSAVQLAEDVLSYSETEIGGLGRAEVKELTAIDGIGATKACAIVASLELARRLRTGVSQEHRTRIREASDVAEMLDEELRHEKREHVIALILNAKCEVEAKVTVSIGELCSASLHPREVFSPAVRRGAAAIIVAHNHPSGDPTPSEEDIAVTRRLVEASRIMGITLIDHIVIGRGTFTSLRAEGVIPAGII